MPYSRQIKSLEDSLNLVESQIYAVENLENPDQERLSKLREAKNSYLLKLRDLYRAQYEHNQEIDYGDDR